MTIDMVTVAAFTFTGLLVLLVLFQLALAFGAPWGAFAWGGQNKGTLPAGYRWASGFSVLIYGFLAALALDRAGVIDLLPPGFSEIGMWVVVGFLTLGVLMNGISRSRPERFTMTPVVLVLALLALVIALSGGAKTFSGMVLDDGSGPVFCTVTLTSYPPQCGNPTQVEGWNWDAVDHELVDSVRWGDYTFRGVEERSVITVTRDVESRD